jgi:hypothetical protein
VFQFFNSRYKSEIRNECTVGSTVINPGVASQPATEAAEGAAAFGRLPCSATLDNRLKVPKTPVIAWLLTRLC